MKTNLQYILKVFVNEKIDNYDNFNVLWNNDINIHQQHKGSIQLIQIQNQNCIHLRNVMNELCKYTEHQIMEP